MMSLKSLWISLFLIAFTLPCGAQLTGTFTLNVSIDSTYFDDCDPGTNCFVVFCGFVEGTLTFQYDGFDGVFDNYTVTDVQWNVLIGGCPANLNVPPELHVGSGTFQIDRQPIPTQQLVLQLSRNNGPDITIDSGPVATTDFPNWVEFDLISFATAEYFSISTSLSEIEFIRGDLNGDGAMSLPDALALLSYLFILDSPFQPTCLDAVDANDSGTTNLLDALVVLNSLFVPNSAPPMAPFPDCGLDPTADALGCESYAPCP